MTRLHLVPLRLREANEAVAMFHRHHKPVRGHLFSIGVADEEGNLVGAAIIGRPVARMLDDKLTAEVTRLVVREGYPNACSMLYSASWRAARAMGYTRMVTYVLESESGVSLKASGWVRVGEAGGGSWSRPSRPRSDKAPTCPKVRWEVNLRTVDQLLC
jgi:hypothetical protein